MEMGWSWLTQDVRTKPTFPNAMPPSRQAGFSKKKPTGRHRTPATPHDSPCFWNMRQAGMCEMEFGDVACVRLSFDINSNPCPTHADFNQTNAIRAIPTTI